jgi:histidyl-tRNA synthetase
MTLQAVRGTADLFGDELARWEQVEARARQLARRYGYQELRTPILEEAALFLRSIGETTDIVQKEMFLFEDRGGKPLVLRPEGTSAIVRAYLEHNLHKTVGFAKLFYAGPMFRAERPQAGRLRQFHQLGAEAIGSNSPWVDAELIAFCMELIAAAGVSRCVLWLSSMGCRDDQQRSATKLREALQPHRAKLCETCQARIEKNVFRVLDCKRPADRDLGWSLTSSRVFLLCPDCQTHFDTVRQALAQSGVPFDDTQVFARGLDYYTRTVFEVRAEGLGAQDAVAAGGRYDHLIEELGGPATGAIGFAAGIERLLMAAKSAPTASAVGEPARAGIYLAVASAGAMGTAFGLVQALRHHGLTAVMDYDGKSLKAQLREADKLSIRWVAIVGDEELRTQQVTLKDLQQGAQETLALDQFAAQMAARTC